MSVMGKMGCWGHSEPLGGNGEGGTAHGGDGDTTASGGKHRLGDGTRNMKSGSGRSEGDWSNRATTVGVGDEGWWWRRTTWMERRRKSGGSGEEDEARKMTRTRRQGDAPARRSVTGGVGGDKRDDGDGELRSSTATRLWLRSNQTKGRVM